MRRKEGELSNLSSGDSDHYRFDGPAPATILMTALPTFGGTAAVAALCLLGCSPPVDSSRSAARSLPPEVPLERPGPEGLNAAVALHLRGVDGDESAAVEALSRLEALAAETPHDPRLLTYLGSARVLRAKRYLAPWKKGETCRAGLALLDRAVDGQPLDVEIRLVRALSTFPLPLFFGRRAESAADFAWVCERVPAVVEAGGPLTREETALAWLHHGYCKRAAGDEVGARKALEEAINWSPDGVGTRARLALSRL